MWNEGDARHELRDHEVSMGRTSGSSEVVVMDERVLEAAARAQPALTNINVTKSSRLHIGPKFVSVTQNVDNTEVVKDLPLPRYLWDIAKSTTRAERLLCAAAMIALFACILLVVYFTVIVKRASEEVVDVAPHEWYIDRDMWLAPPFDKDEETTDRYDPLRLVVIAHTVSPECTRFINCAAELRNLQGYYAKTYGYDLPYNFMIGNDGRVYEARGWNVVGAHTLGFNRCSLGLAFIGDYREGLPSYAKVTPLQLQRAKMLLDRGVELGHLHPSYHVVGAKDLKPTASPGANLYKAIQLWSHYDHENMYYKKTCDEIMNMYKNETESEITSTLKTIVKEKNSKV
ncbi:peptidoglycan recognition protein 1-like isoform X2 [Trichoplusia ni]|uniref:Peptidoglycan recognition protein 1-like isoform X2 n=1 Tax=Trichoplusia ni TaxID=7111 RepID=A0A7E5WFP8_TRINI|nr:peptidoglycan recognition protein 1-like isoform X2 [Trichoplusia ni]